MNLQDIFNYINFIINKEMSGKFISPNEFTLLLQNNSFKYFKKFYDVPEEYQVGAPLSRIQWELTTTAKKKLQRFQVTRSTTNGNALAFDPLGFSSIPDDVFYIDYFNNDTGVGRFIKAHVFDSVRTNPITMPTKKYPVGTIKSNRLQFNPVPDDTFEFHYLRYPEVPFYDFYTDANDVVHYLAPNETSPADATPANKASESVELDWDDESVWDIIDYILDDIGMGIDRPDVVQFANQSQVKGT